MRIALEHSQPGIINPVRDSRAHEITLRGCEPRNEKQERAGQKSIQPFAIAKGGNSDPAAGS
jgi:hypothetical protein